MAKRNEVDFFKLSAEEQAREIERQTKKLIARLPDLKKNLKMYGEVSDELYNLTEEEVSTIGTTYAKAVRGGEISTPSSKRAYQKFINDMRKYTRRSIGDIAQEVAEKRFDDWWKTIKDNASTEELEYCNYLVMQMDDKMKRGFTMSRYFLENANWNSEDTFVKSVSDGDISMMTLELELYLEKNHPEVNTRNIYNKEIATDGLNVTRQGVLKKKSRKKG